MGGLPLYLMERTSGSIGVAGLAAGLATLAACSAADAHAPTRSPPADPPHAVAASEDTGSGPAVDAGSADSGLACRLSQDYGSDVCNRCVGTKCCAVVAACESDTACRALQSCLIDCQSVPDSRGCYDTCVVSHPDGKPLWQPVESCWYGNDACFFDGSWTP